MKQYTKDVMENKKNSIIFSVETVSHSEYGLTHFGGVPDVPAGFEWPQYTDKEIDETYSLDFVVQFDCEELKKYDLENIIPEKGLLSVFYDLEGQPCEGESNDKGCIRVFWFEDIHELKPAKLPEDIDKAMPCFSMNLDREDSYLSWEDYKIIYGEMNKRERMEYCSKLSDLGYNQESKKSKLLGYPDVIQNSMLEELQNEYTKNRDTIKNFDEWALLLQLSSLQCDDFELLFGDCGKLFLYIRKKDLLEKNFDNIHVILQA